MALGVGLESETKTELPVRVLGVAKTVAIVVVATSDWDDSVNADDVIEEPPAVLGVVPLVWAWPVRGRVDRDDGCEAADIAELDCLCLDVIT